MEIPGFESQLIIELIIDLAQVYLSSPYFIYKKR